MDGEQGSVPTKLTNALVTLAAGSKRTHHYDSPPESDAVAAFKAKAAELLAQAEHTSSCPPTSRGTTKRF